MADNFLQAINTGINLGHMADSVKMQRAQMERMAQQMQMEGLDRALKMQTYLDAQGEKASRKAIYAPESTKMGGDEYTGPMMEATPGGPGREALKSQFPDSYGILADQMLNFGKVDPGYATLIKAQKPTAPKTSIMKIYGPDGATQTVEAGQGYAPPTGWSLVAPAPDREVNVSNDVDTILGGMFRGYYTDKGVRKRALDWYGTPAGSSAVQKKVAEFAASKMPPQFYPVPTEGGITPFQTKGAGAGGFKPSPDNPKRPPQESDITAERNYNSADAIISELENKFTSAQKSLPTDAVDRVTGYPARAIGIYAQTDPELASVKALIQASESKLIRALGEVGTLTDRDVARAEAAMPTVNDTKDVRDKKFVQLRGLLKEIYEKGKRYDTTKQNVGSSPSVAAPASGPRIGEVVDGFRFMGGNPADQKSWKKVGK